MIKRTIDISEQAYLHITHGQLCVDKMGDTVARIAVEDLGLLILQHPAITITQTVISQCQKHNAVIVFCDERHLPISVILPLWDGHSLHTKVLREQLSATTPTCKRLWQQVVKTKISEQARTLEQAGGSSQGLYRLRDKVKSADTGNCEAQAAQYYWKQLMGHDFRRDINADGINSLLNYGYSILRAMVARALVGSGLHPAIGLHHKNQYNGLCLADDIMEPFRPWVDWLVFEMIQHNMPLEISKSTKQPLLSLLSEDVIYDKRKMPLMVAVHLLSARLKQALTDKQVTLRYPERLFC